MNIQRALFHTGEVRRDIEEIVREFKTCDRVCFLLCLRRS